MTNLRPPKGFRPHMPMAVRIKAALLMLGLDPDAVQWDHDPALQLRVWNEAAGDTIPAANDPRYITPRARDDHNRKTNGTKATTYGSDKHAIAKAKRMEEARAALEAGEAKAAKRKWASRKIPSRPFPKRMNGTAERR